MTSRASWRTGWSKKLSYIRDSLRTLNDEVDNGSVHSTATASQHSRRRQGSMPGMVSVVSDERSVSTESGTESPDPKDPESPPSATATPPSPATLYPLPPRRRRHHIGHTAHKMVEPPKVLEDPVDAYSTTDSLAGSTRSGRSLRSTRSSRSDTSTIVESLIQTVSKSRTVPEGTTATEHVLAIPELQLAGLMRVLSSRERRHGIPAHLSRGNDLARRLRDVFSYPAESCPHWLLEPLYEGLLNGGDAINVAVSPPSGAAAKAMPLLAWLCQHNSLQKLFGFKGQDDLVSLALAAGADPNHILENGSTPIFFAVKYGSLETVQLLIQNGASVDARDRKKRSCLWNALERPDPAIIRCLLQHLPADERFPYHPNSSKTTSYQSAVDYLFAAQLSLSFDPHNNPEYPWSWQVLGKPTVENVAESLIEFGRYGVTFSREDITIALVSFVLRGDDPNKKRNRYPYYAEAKASLETLAQMFVGLWLPFSVHRQINSTPPKRRTSVYSDDTTHASFLDDDCSSHDGLAPDLGPLQEECALCCRKVSSEDGDEDDEAAERDVHGSVTLYCGHEFCRQCLLETTATHCPLCSRAFCLDVCGQDNAFGDLYGPDILTSEQLRMECQARNFITMMRKEEALRARLRSVVMGGDQLHGVELNTNVPIFNGDVNLLSARHGHVVVPIMVKTVQILAYISTTSDYTLLSPELVSLFGLKKTGKESSDFLNILGDIAVNGKVAAVEEFNFQIAGVDVSLRSAMETSLPSCMGVQLGRDFLLSGAWCVIDVRLDGVLEDREDPMVSVDGTGNMNLAAHTKRKEELRYYARDGKSARLPLLHLQPFKEGGLSNWVSLKMEADFEECHWCCRSFPEGMKEVNGAYYCTEACLASASQLRSIEQ